MAKAIAVACFVLASVLLHSQDGPGHARVSFDDSLGSLARAKDLTQLEQQWAKGPKDYPHRAVHAAMFVKLKGANSDSILISAMPRNGTEMEAFYNAQNTEQGQDMAVTDAYANFYTHLADAVGRRPEKLAQFLRMIHAFHYVDIVDEWPWLCGLASKIYDAHPGAYLSAINRVEPQFKADAIACKQAPDAP